MIKYLLAVVVIFFQVQVAVTQPPEIPKPHKFVGHSIGADKKLFSWQTIYEYLKILDDKSDRVKLEELGSSTLGKPFILLQISTPNNLRNIAKYRNLQKQAAYPNNLSEKDINQLSREKKAVVLAVFNSNIQGIASVQGVLELAYQLATNQRGGRILHDEILDDIILLLVPDSNPDGMQKIVEWYNNYLDTPHEGSPLPGLPHEYADNIIADFSGLNLVETKLITNQLYNKWYPEIIISVSDALQLPRILARVNQNKLTDDLMAYMNLPGAALNLVEDEGQFLLNHISSHNQIYFDVTFANTLYGTPLFFSIGSPATQNLHTKFSVRWTGGAWTMRNIIDSEISLFHNLLGWVSNNKSGIIENYCNKNIQSKVLPPQDILTYLIPAKQNDITSLFSMLHFLKQNGVKIYKSPKEVEFATGLSITPEDFIIPRSQPFRKFIDNMFFNEFDISTRFGIEIIPVKESVDVRLTEIKYLNKKVSDFSGKGDYLILNTSNDAYRLVNRLFQKKKEVYQFKEETRIGGSRFMPGTFYLQKDELDLEELKPMLADLALEVKTIDFDFRRSKVFRLHPPKVGLYQSWLANTDEGWLRFVLDEFGFQYQTVYGSKVRTGSVNQYDVFVLPDIEGEILVSGWNNEGESDFIPLLPRPYKDGITTDGIENLKKYVREGGTLLVLGETCRLIAKTFKLPLRELAADIESTKDFALVPVKINNKTPLSFGMQDKLKAVYTNDFFLQPLPWQKETEIIAYLPDAVKATNGHISSIEKQNLPVVMRIPMGEGEVVLMLIRPQFKGQIPATYKFLFNSLLNANSENAIL